MCFDWLEVLGKCKVFSCAWIQGGVFGLFCTIWNDRGELMVMLSALWRKGEVTTGLLRLVAGVWDPLIVSPFCLGHVSAALVPCIFLQLIVLC